MSIRPAIGSPCEAFNPIGALGKAALAPDFPPDAYMVILPIAPGPAARRVGGGLADAIASLEQTLAAGAERASKRAPIAIVLGAPREANAEDHRGILARFSAALKPASVGLFPAKQGATADLEAGMLEALGFIERAAVSRAARAAVVRHTARKSVRGGRG